MISIFLFILISIALFIVGVLVVGSNDFKDIKTNLKNTISNYSISNSNNNLLTSLEQLDDRLETLKSELEDERKTKEKDYSGAEILRVDEKIEALNETSKQVKLYYLGLKQDILKSEQECKSLYEKIEEYKESQEKFRNEVQGNIKYYYDVLNTIQSTIKKIPERNTNSRTFISLDNPVKDSNSTRNFNVKMCE